VQQTVVKWHTQFSEQSKFLRKEMMTAAIISYSANVEALNVTMTKNPETSRRISSQKTLISRTSNRRKLKMDPNLFLCLRNSDFPELLKQNFAKLQASAAVQLRPSVIYDIMQRWFVVG
jgi:hypothetical protein